MKRYLKKNKKTYQSTGTITDIHMGNVLEILEPSPIKLLPHVNEEQGKVKYINSSTHLHDDNASQPDSYRLSRFLQIIESTLPNCDSIYKKRCDADNEDPFQNSAVDSIHRGDLEQENYLKEICESSPSQNQLHDDNTNRGRVRKVAALGYILKKRFCANDKRKKKQNIVRRYRKNVIQRLKRKSNISSEQKLDITESLGEEEPSLHHVQDQHLDTSEESRVADLEHEISAVINSRYWTKDVHNSDNFQQHFESVSPNVYAVVNELLDAAFPADYSNQPKQATEWQSPSETERWSLEDPDLLNAEEERQTFLQKSLYDPKYYVAEPNGLPIPNTPWKVRYSLYGPVFQRKPKTLPKKNDQVTEKSKSEG